MQRLGRSGYRDADKAHYCRRLALRRPLAGLASVVEGSVSIADGLRMARLRGRVARTGGSRRRTGILQVHPDRHLSHATTCRPEHRVGDRWSDRDDRRLAAPDRREHHRRNHRSNSPPAYRLKGRPNPRPNRRRKYRQVSPWNFRNRPPGKPEAAPRRRQGSAAHSRPKDIAKDGFFNLLYLLVLLWLTSACRRIPYDGRPMQPALLPVFSYRHKSGAWHGLNPQ